MARRHRARYKTPVYKTPAPAPNPETPLLIADIPNKVRSGQKVELHFYSVDSILEYIKKADSMFPGGTYSHTYPNGDFCSFSWQQSVEMLRSGWPEGVKEIDLKTKAIEHQISEVRPEYQHELQGDYLDIGHYLSGQPDCFMTVKPVEYERPEVDIMMNTSYSSGISQEVIINRGAAITALIDALQRDHFVNLVFVQRATGYFGNKTEMDVNIFFHVNTQNDYSRDLISFVAANPAWLRRIIFSVEEIALNERDCGSYGTPQDIIPGKDSIYFPCLRSNSEYKHRFITMESTIQEVERLITETEAKHAKAC